MRKLAALAMLVATVPLGGCAQQFLTAAKSDCAAFGFVSGTPEYAQCVQSQFAARQGRFQQSMTSLSAPPVAAAEADSGPAGSLRSQSVNGNYRTCVYDRLGSAFTLSIPYTQMCPLTYP